ncbi:hypothetical protein [Pontibacter ramchanderi]|uniref:Outer membrane protein with glycine zipper n=1 Tax=Pontibacter ramchanderi TaxID=1179743 RepID=A0A2N3U7D8_9BACT|nr:hypothetical protein [Pontibacter ramchanderi]PKV62657.1 outer membrane protein with glycine zipper [Pontibacter ramchanderi]
MKKVSYIMSLALMASVAFGGSAEAQEKRTGWSPQAKGAVIGAGTGAAAGAIIHKRNRVVGGVVGGVAGGAVGYGVGKVIDNKQKREAEEARIAAAERAAAAQRVATAERAAANRATVAKNTPAPAKKAPAAQSSLMAATPAETAAANSLAMMYASEDGPTPQMVYANFLPNHDYGDRSKPYYTSEVRRKSW